MVANDFLYGGAYFCWIRNTLLLCAMKHAFFNERVTVISLVKEVPLAGLPSGAYFCQAIYNHFGVWICCASLKQALICCPSKRSPWHCALKGLCRHRCKKADDAKCQGWKNAHLEA